MGSHRYFSEAPIPNPGDGALKPTETVGGCSSVLVWLGLFGVKIRQIL